MAFRVCVYICHENINLLLNRLSKHVKGSICSDLHRLLLVMNQIIIVIMSSNCLACENYFDLYVKNNVIDKNARIKWYQWQNINGYVTKLEEQDSVE